MNNKNLKRHLNSVEVPNGLANKIKHNLPQQQPGYKKLAMAGFAASIVFSILIISWSPATTSSPELIVAALADIKQDAHLTTGLTTKQENWLTAHNVALPPKDLKVEMSKYCNIAGFATSHLRIAGKKRGQAHIFLYPGDLNLAKYKGTHDNMNWINLKMNQGMSVLVMYTEDMKKEGVNHILKTMFPNQAIQIT